MYIKTIMSAIAISLLAIFQGAFIPALSKYFNEINILILILVFILSFWNLRICLYWAVGFAVMMDLYSFLFFGVYLIIFPVVMLTVNLLFTNFFTNKSLYSLLTLSLFASMLFKVLLFLIVYIMYFLGIKDYFLQISLHTETRVLLIEGIISILFFYFFTYINKNSRAVFLSKYK